jgi:AcrR family transcriptional regulator
VVDAAIELFAERGIEGTSIDSIAARSGVSKATIYKHWPDKETLCLEALGRLHGIGSEGPAFDSGDLRQDLIDFLEHKPPSDCGELRDKLMPHIVAYAARNREFGNAWRAYVMEPRRAKAIELMDRGIALGYFSPHLNKTLGLAFLIGPMLYKHIFHETAEFPEDLAAGVADAFWRAFALPERERPKGRKK